MQTPQPPKEPNAKTLINPLLALRDQFTSLVANVSASLSDHHHQNPSPLKTLNPLLALTKLGNQARLAVEAAAAGLAPPSSGLNRSWARAASLGAHRFDLALKTDLIEERLAGIPVYALSNSAEEFVLVTGKKAGKNLGFFCFKEEDAKVLLDQMKFMDNDIRTGSKVVAVALNKVFQLKVNGVAFRFIPEACQVANAIKEEGKAGDSVGSFSGVPVFQSKSLVLKSQNKKYRPVFFRKEDLEESLRRASQEQRLLNPSLRKGDIQVGVLEEIIKALKGNSTSKWDDVVFIPPGFNVPTSISEERAIANA